MKLTKNFTLEELCNSQEAIAHGFTEQFHPPLEIQSNLRKLAENILQPLRDGWTGTLGWKNDYGAAIDSNCAYRCKRLNDHVGGKPTSQHLHGNAADITAGSQAENKLLFTAIQKLQLPFDQLIDEKNYSWIHVSYDETRNRRQILHL
jgi:hypothetical protein